MTEIPTPWMRMDQLSRWPLVHLTETGQTFLQIDDVSLQAGTQWVSVAEVTHLLPDMLRNRPTSGPGEGVATVGQEGIYALVRMVDGRDVQAIVTNLAVSVNIILEPRR